MSIDIERRVRKANELTDEGHLEDIHGEAIAHRLLDDIQHRRMGPMTETNQEKAERRLASAPARGSGDRWTRRWLAVAAVVVVVAGAGLVYAQNGERDVASAESLVAEEMLTSFLAHDMAFEEHFASDEARYDFSKWTEWFFGLGLKGEFACLGDATEASMVTCNLTTQNDLAALGGIPAVERTIVFTVTDGSIVRSEEPSHPGIAGNDLPDLVSQVSGWIAGRDRDVWDASFAAECEYGVNPDCVDFGGATWLATSENAALLIEYAPELIEQSPRWPLGE